jgi:FkbM family methyltransferase
MSVKSWLKPYVARLPGALSTFRYASALATFHRTSPVATPYGFEWVGYDWMRFGTFETTETEFLLRRLGNCDVFVDVGANCGMYTCLAASRGVATLAFEPLEENLRYLYSNVLRNRWTNVEIFPMGLGREPSIATLFGVAAGASLVPGWGGNDPLGHTVSVTKLDTIVADRFRGKRLLVKVDIEGAELDLLAGATSTLVRDPQPTWLVEVCLTEHHPAHLNPQFRDVFEVFWNAGYKAHTVERESREVTPFDVDRWIRERRRDFGGEMIAFSGNRPTTGTSRVAPNDEAHH